MKLQVLNESININHEEQLLSKNILLTLAIIISQRKIRFEWQKTQSGNGFKKIKVYLYLL
jgi:hypothetical protein